MTQTPEALAAIVMEQLRILGHPPTPENYAEHYYYLSGEARPVPAEPAEGRPHAMENQGCLELLDMLKGLVNDAEDKAGLLAKDLEAKNGELSHSVEGLKKSRERNEILRLLALIVSQTNGIQHSVEHSHRELSETRVALQRMESELLETRQMLNEDALTGTLNRRGLDQTLEREVARAERNKTRLTLAMLDLDHFKNINDTWGHEVGDKMLVHFANLAKSVMRKSDALVRYGGEEFTLLLPETDSRGAQFVLARLKMLLSKTPLMHEGKDINITFSAGLAQLKSEENGHAMLHRADEALYIAKQAGRNCIKFAG